MHIKMSNDVATAQVSDDFAPVHELVTSYVGSCDAPVPARNAIKVALRKEVFRYLNPSFDASVGISQKG